jgi:hypothetical protein
MIGRVLDDGGFPEAAPDAHQEESACAIGATADS